MNYKFSVESFSSISFYLALFVVNMCLIGEISASSLCSTKLYVNLNIPEVAQYLARFEELKVTSKLLGQNLQNTVADDSSNLIQQRLLIC